MDRGGLAIGMDCKEAKAIMRPLEALSWVLAQYTRRCRCHSREILQSARGLSSQMSQSLCHGYQGYSHIYFQAEAKTNHTPSCFLSPHSQSSHWAFKYIFHLDIGNASCSPASNVSYNFRLHNTSRPDRAPFGLSGWRFDFSP